SMVFHGFSDEPAGLYSDSLLERVTEPSVSGQASPESVPDPVPRCRPVQLTNADRRTLLESFRKLARGWSGDDAGLIAWATAWAASLSPTFGFESGLARDVFFLGDVLRKAEAGGECARLARGGLAYLNQNNPGKSSSSGPFGFLDDSFVAGYA